MSLILPPSKRRLKRAQRQKYLRRRRLLRRLRHRLRKKSCYKGRPFRGKHVKMATPLWADRVAIAKIYAQAVYLTRMSGLRYTVDHIIPLRGKYVCGLHIAENLAVMVDTENVAKGNWHESELENISLVFVSTVVQSVP